MMTFIILTLSFTIAILLASAIALFIMMQPKVIKAYMKWVCKYVNQMDNALYEMDEELK